LTGAWPAAIRFFYRYDFDARSARIALAKVNKILDEGGTASSLSRDDTKLRPSGLMHSSRCTMDRLRMTSRVDVHQFSTGFP